MGRQRSQPAACRRRAPFAQFPAPPDDVKEVDVQLPTMTSVRIKISR
ncbi:hypothetical protein V7793_06415 [Streptomyces sp. KLMMK]